MYYLQHRINEQWVDVEQSDLEGVRSMWERGCKAANRPISIRVEYRRVIFTSNKY